MTPRDAAHAAADLEQVRQGNDAGWLIRPLIEAERDLYVRAFLAGVQWQQEQASALVQSVEIINRDAVMAHMQKRLDEAGEAEARLARWRSWTQFVYLGGGPATADDDTMQHMVCEANDRDIERARQSAPK